MVQCIVSRCRYADKTYSSNTKAKSTCKILNKAEDPGPETIVAIDAEFVALQMEETEVKADGTRETIRPSRLSLARVSALRGSGEQEGTPFIDDYIVTHEPVVDYLTLFSGIEMGDLDIKRSKHPLVSLKVSNSLNIKRLPGDHQLMSDRWRIKNFGCCLILAVFLLVMAS